MISRKILLTSLPRSGSTWVLRMLGVGGHVVGLHEPDHLDVAGLGEAGMHPYANDCPDIDAYHAMYSKIFRGTVPTASAFSRAGVRALKSKVRSLKPGAQTLIVKSVFSLHNTEWIAREFSPQVVVLVRHPCSLIHSIHRKWPDARLKDPLSQPAFVREHLSPYADVLRHALTAYECLAARVGAYYRAVANAMDAHPSWILVSHEQLCQDPIAEFGKLYDRLGLEWSHAVETAIADANRPKGSDDIAHVNRLASDEVGKWRRLLTDQDVAAISKYYCALDLPYYREFC